MPSSKKGVVLVIEGIAICQEPDSEGKCPRMVEAEISTFYGVGCQPPTIRINGMPSKKPLKLLIKAKVRR